MKNRFITLLLAGMAMAGCGTRLLREADLHYSNYEYAVAARQYENYLKSDSSAAVMLKLADCYRHMNRHNESVKWYAKSIDAPAASPEDKLRYAQELRETGNPEAARTWYDAYLLTHPSDSLAIYQRASCNVSEITDPFYDVTIAEIKVNSSCFSPMLYNDRLYYSVEAPHQPGQPVNQWTGNGFLDLYSADPSDPSHATQLDSTINTDLHESNMVFAPSGTIIYFTRSARKEIIRKKKNTEEISAAPDRTNNLEICSAELVNGKWTNVKVLPFNQPEYSCGHPAITASGTRLYFASDLPGGMGGTDIYYSDFVNGTWSAPQNAGPNINTAGNEMFPVISAASTRQELYFSSDGRIGYGGLDIFRAQLINDLPWSAQRLPAPFNSTGDDFGITFSADQTWGYFSSNRNTETGDDRIYRFQRKSPLYFVNLLVLDKETQAIVPNTEVEITNTKSMLTWKVNTDSSGRVLFPADSITTYGFKLLCNNYFCGFHAASTGGFRGRFYDTTYATINLEKIVINKTIRLDNIYYDYNKWDIRPDAAVELDKLVKIMIDNPKIRIELSSHTDARGSDKYNMTLSQKRAQSAVDYIVSKGISKDRIYAKGYGESKLLNKCGNGVKCTEEEHQWNRRTEFKVVEIVQ